MPFDALVMRAVTRELEPSLVGGRLVWAGQTPDGLFLGVLSPAAAHTVSVAVMLNPAWAHIRRLPGRPAAARPAVWLTGAVGAQVTAMEQPRWERVWVWSLEQQDEVGRWQHRRLVLELAGHLTNAILLDADDRVVDAYRRIPPGRPGRVIFPGQPYAPPPAVPDPCLTGEAAHLPPWARRLAAGEVASLCREWEAAPWKPQVGLYQGRPELWIRPWHADCHEESAWSAALAHVFTARQRQLQADAARRQAEVALTRRLEQVEAQIERATAQLREHAEPDRWRALGDAALAFGVPLGDDRKPAQLVDPSTGQRWDLPWDAVEGGWVELARYSYAQYQKARHTKAALERLLPRLERDRSDLAARLERVLTATDPEALRQAAADAGPPAPDHRAQPYRRFVSGRGLEIWVGRTAEENQSLTFRTARPDDLWFHVKQYPGSHVLLRCGKHPPHPDDVVDAAQLAAFYSRAGRGSQVAVDYTARKFVRKRPHAGPGQVLYTREKTLYVTPDPERLKQLGAVSRTLVEEGQ